MYSCKIVGIRWCLSCEYDDAIKSMCGTYYKYMYVTHISWRKARDESL